MQKEKQLSKSKYLRLMTGVGIILAGCITGTVQAEQAARIGAAKVVADKALPAILSNLDKLAREAANPSNCVQRNALIKKYAQIAGDADLPPITQKELQNHFFKGCLDEKSATPPPSRPSSPLPAALGVAESKKATTPPPSRPSSPPPVAPKTTESKSTWKSVRTPTGKSGTERASPPRSGTKSPTSAKETEKDLENVASEAQKTAEAQKATQMDSEGVNIRQSLRRSSKPLPVPKKRTSGNVSDGPPTDLPPLPPSDVPPLPPVAPSSSGLLGKKPTAPKPSATIAPEAADKKTDLPPPQQRRGGLLGDLQNENPMARLKKTPLQPTKQAEPKAGIAGVLEQAMHGRRAGIAGGMKPADKATLDKLTGEGKTPKEIRDMMDNDFDLFHDTYLVEEELKKLEKR